MKCITCPHAHTHYTHKLTDLRDRNTEQRKTSTTAIIIIIIIVDTASTHLTLVRSNPNALAYISGLPDSAVPDTLRMTLAE